MRRQPDRQHSCCGAGVSKMRRDCGCKWCQKCISIVEPRHANTQDAMKTKAIEIPLPVECEASPTPTASQAATANRQTGNAAPALSENAIWCEVLAVLAIGVIPSAAHAI